MSMVAELFVNKGDKMIFEAPDSSFAPVPWWAWTGKMEKKEMLRQLDLMKNGGIHEFFIFALYGLEQPVFLSEEWFEYVRFTIDEAGRRDMKLWIYDDLNWPSGSGGGKVLRDHPEFRMRMLTCDTLEFAEGASQAIDPAAPPLWVGLWHDSKMCELAIENGKIVNDSGTDGTLAMLTVRLFDNVRLNSCGSEGTWNQPGYLDTLNPDAVKCWMSGIHEEYRRRFYDEFGKTIKGFFYDEPSMTCWDEKQNAPWTGTLESDFLRCYGYECRKELWKLFFDASDVEQFRYDYWRMTSERFGIAFSKQIADWCAVNHLISTGHAAPEEPMFQRIILSCTGEIHNQLKHNQMPGIDLLGDVTCFTNEPSPWYGNEKKWGLNLIVTGKRGSSTARYSGATRIMCEAFGVRDWNSTLQGQRRINDFLAAMGINFINDNSLIYTISEFRKRAIAGKHFSQPYWKYYSYFASYSSRINAFAATGFIDTAIALLFPTSMNMSRTTITIERSARINEDTAPSMLATAEAMLRGHHDFELLFEDVALQGKVKNGILSLPNAEFKVIILPKCIVLNDKLKAILSEFTHTGGTLIAVEAKPGQYVVRDGRIAAPLCDLDCRLLKLDDDNFSSKLLLAIAEGSAPLYRLTGNGADGVIASLRKDRNSRYLLLANQTPGAKHFKLQHEIPGTMALFHPDDGIFYRADKDEELFLDVDQSVIAVFSPDGVGELPKITTSPLWPGGKHPVESIAIPQWQLELDTPNSFCCPLELHIDDQWLKVPANGALPFQLYPENQPFLHLRGEFDISSSVPNDLSLLFDTGEFDQLMVNDLPCEKRKNVELWDHRNVRVEIASACLPGKNSFTVRCRIQKWYSERFNLCNIYRSLNMVVEPVALFGRFSFEAGKIAPLSATATPGDLRLQGLREFAGSVTVHCLFESSGLGNYLSLKDTEAVIESELNGVKLGVRPWTPRCFALPEGALRAGENRLTLKLSNSLGNLLTTFYNNRPGVQMPFILPETLEFLCN